MKKSLVLFLAALVMAFMFTAPSTKAGQRSDIPRWLNGKLSGKLSRDMNGVVKFFNENKSTFKIEDAAKEFKQSNEIEDAQGLKHIRVQQVVDGIPVWGSDMYIHFDKDGIVYSVNGSYDPTARNYARKKLINKQNAIEIASKEVSFNSLEMPMSAELYLYKSGEIYVPSYLVNINFLDPEPGNWLVLVNAHDGSILDKYNNFKTGKPVSGSPATGTGIGVLGDTKSINIFGTTGSYSMIDRSRPMYANGGEVLTYDSGNTYRTPGSMVTDTDTVFNSSRHPAAVDAHFYAGVVYNYYLQKFNRNSIDNKGMDIISSVHYGVRYNNAGWTGSQMIYGDGDGTNFTYLSGGIDVIAHELTHGVTDYTSNLIYQDQSGALNESFSDVFGVIVENWYKQGNWLMGEDIYTPNKAGDALRDVANPAAYGDPDHMSKYVYTTQDNGGVHTNSGIPNKAAYNAYLNLGRDFTKLEAIYYRALTQIMTSGSTFSDAKMALAQAAAELYGAGSPEVTAINNAFTAVGIN